MPFNPSQFWYQSPPGSGKNDGALPQVYDPRWGRWTNLTLEQIGAFQAFPEDLIAYIKQSRWQWEVRGTNTPGPATPYITLPTDAAHPAISGIQLYLDDRSQSKIGQLAQAIDKSIVAPNAISRFPFFAVNGVYQLSGADCTALYAYVVRYVQSTYTVAATLIAGVNAKTVTTRAQIDAAFAAIQVQ